MNRKNEKTVSILRQLQGVFLLGVFFLILSLLVSLGFNRKILGGISEAHKLDGGIISVGHIRESVTALVATVEAAADKQKKVEIKPLYVQRYRQINSDLDKLHKEFRGYVKANSSIEQAKLSLQSINNLAESALEAENIAAMTLISIKQNKIETDELLSSAAIEFRLLLDTSYKELEKKKNDPFFFGLFLTILFIVVLLFVSGRLLLRVKKFISGHIKATEKISKGNWSVRIPVVQNDELGLITTEFNGMIIELQSVKNELERSNQDLLDFAHSASHDLQTPLRHVSAFSELIMTKRHQASDEEVAGWVNNIKIGTHNVIALIEDLLEFSKIGQQGIKVEAIEVGEVISEVLYKCKNLYPNLAISNTASANVHGYRSLIYLVFQNLVDNGVKYCPVDRDPIISIDCKVHDGIVKFFVSDNGAGIPDDQKQRIFGLFRRMHADSEVKGTGAGLAICRKIVTRHGGEIWVEDNKSGGATFVFTLPVV